MVHELYFIKCTYYDKKAGTSILHKVNCDKIQEIEILFLGFTGILQGEGVLLHFV